MIWDKGKVTQGHEVCSFTILQKRRNSFSLLWIMLLKILLYPWTEPPEPQLQLGLQMLLAIFLQRVDMPQGKIWLLLY